MKINILDKYLNKKQIVMTNKALSFLWRFIKLQRVGFVCLIITSSIWSLNESLFPYFIKKIANTLYNHSETPQNILLLVILPFLQLMTIWLICELAIRLHAVLAVQIFPHFCANIRETIYAYVLKHSLAYFVNNSTGSITNKINDLPRNSEYILKIFLYGFFGAGGYIIMSSYILLQANKKFFYIAFAWLIIHMCITCIFTKYCNKLTRIHADSISTITGKITDTINNIITVHLFSLWPYERDYFSKHQELEIIKSQQAFLKIEFMKLLQGFITFCFIMCLVFNLIRGWNEGWVTLGDFSLVCVSASGISGTIWWVSLHIADFFNELGYIQAALNTLNQPYEIIDRPNAKPLQVTHGEICFNNVIFCYEPNNYIFNNESVIIKGGQKVGLVGLTGAGKTTFINLILRLYDISGGSITIDGQDIKNVTLTSLRNNIAVVPQRPLLLNRSIFENIHYGNINALPNEVVQAAKLAYCHEFIMNMEDGYNTIISENGANFSIGQQQRIAIARGILKYSPIVFLDEFTSALDSITEEKIQESLNYLIKGCTCIIIAHRLATLYELERILVFHNGRIIEDGTHESLLKNKHSYYTKLWEAQAAKPHMA